MGMIVSGTVRLGSVCVRLGYGWRCPCQSVPAHRHLPRPLAHSLTDSFVLPFIIACGACVTRTFRKRQSKEEQFGASDGSNMCSKIKLPTPFSYVSVFSCFPLEDYVPLTSRQTLCPFALAFKFGSFPSYVLPFSCFAVFVWLPLTFCQTPYIFLSLCNIL